MPRHYPGPAAHGRSVRVLALCLTVAATRGVAPPALRAQPPAAAPGPARDTATPPRGVRERGLQVGRGEWAVDAVLTVPAGTAPAPAVVLMHGSGGGTKDGDVGPNKVYREMAWALGARGVAVLRYDKRLTAHAARARALGRPLTMDEDQTDDGVAAARLLQHTEGVDPRRVHVLAVSQSTAVAADVAARVAQAGGPPLAGLVLVSASARGPAQMIREQTAYGARVARQRGDSAGLREALAVQAEAERMARADLPDSARVLGMDLGYWRSMDPRRTWRETAAFLAAGGRVFVASGGRDFQTTAGDFAAWRRALAAHRGATFHRYADLNHLMQPGVGKMTPDEFERPMRLSPQFLDDVARWTTRVSGSPAGPRARAH